MRRFTLSLFTLLFSATVMSQNVTVAEMRSWQEYVINGQYDIVSKKMEAAFHGVIEDEIPDSIRYYYFVINAAIEGKNNNNHIKERDYCKKALYIRENKLGILDPEYIELLWALGSGYEETEVDSAVCYYQKAIVICQTIIKNPLVIERSQWAFMIHTYGLVLGDLAKLYEKKGWLNEVIELYNYGHSLCSSPTLSFDVTSYIYKNQIAWFCERYGNYKMAIDAYDDALSLINERVGKNNKDYVDELFFKANVLCKNGQYVEGVTIYKEAIEIANTALEPSDELLRGLYGNYYHELAQLGDINTMNQISHKVRSLYSSQYTTTFDYCDCLALQKNKKYTESLAKSSLPYLKLRRDNKETTQSYRDFFNLFVNNYNLNNQADSLIYFCESEKYYLRQKKLAMQAMVYFDACNIEGVHYLNLNDYNNALLNFKDAEVFCSSVFDKENGSHALIYHNLGRCYMQMNDYSKAHEYLVKSQKLQTQLYGKANNRTILYLQEVESLLK